MKVLEISAEATLPLRSDVLRFGQGLENCIFEGDSRKETIHFGVVINQSVIGICSLYKSNNENILSNNTWQIRGMATQLEYRKKGVGTLLLNHAIGYAERCGGDIVWCNARESALHFYIKSGFLMIGNKFHIRDIGPHYLMSLFLKKRPNNGG